MKRQVPAYRKLQLYSGEQHRRRQAVSRTVRLFEKGGKGVPLAEATYQLAAFARKQVNSCMADLLGNMNGNGLDDPESQSIDV